MRMLVLLLFVTCTLSAQDDNFLDKLGEKLSYENDTTVANAYLKSKGELYQFSLSGDTLFVHYQALSEMINQLTGEVYDTESTSRHILPLANIAKLKVKKNFFRDFENCLSCFKEVGASLIITGTNCEKPFLSKALWQDYRDTGFISLSTDRAQDVSIVLQLAEYLVTIEPKIELVDQSAQSPNDKDSKKAPTTKTKPTLR